jgi:tRNA threonylcarbamoyladenosine biosynthesis protein TsaE
MKPRTYNVANIADWSKVIEDLLPHFQGKNLFLLEGDLGSGKTTFVSLVAKKLGINFVSSPTFALIQQYGQIVHADLYRLEQPEEIDATGFWELFEDDQNIVFVEWPSKVSDDHWPLDWNITKIKISKLSDSERKVEVFT